MKVDLSKVIFKNDLLEELFIKREMDLEIRTEEDKEYITNNHLQDVTQTDLKNQILNLQNVPNEMKEKLIIDLDKIIENNGLIHSYSCKKYYFAGINDILNIVFNKEDRQTKGIID